MVKPFPMDCPGTGQAVTCPGEEREPMRAELRATFELIASSPIEDDASWLARRALEADDRLRSVRSVDAAASTSDTSSGPDRREAHASYPSCGDTATHAQNDGRGLLSTERQ